MAKARKYEKKAPSKNDHQIVGIPAYSINFFPAYRQKFNNQSIPDEMNTKLLLLMPLIPPRYHRQIRLNHLRRSLNVNFLEGNGASGDYKQDFDFEQNAALKRSKKHKGAIVFATDSERDSE